MQQRLWQRRTKMKKGEKLKRKRSPKKSRQEGLAEVEQHHQHHNMEQETDKLIEDQLKTLPQALQRAITLTPWRVLVKNIATANNLDEAKSESLETEAMLVIYGFQPQEELVANITREIAIDPVFASILDKEIDEKVFQVVLDKANEIAATEGEETLQSAASAPVEPLEEAPQIVVEPPKPGEANQKSVNLIPPPPEEMKLEPPKAELSPSSLSPGGKPPLEERKKLVPEMPDNKVHYQGGQDPYREPI